MTETCIESIDLSNGYVLEIVDQSRMIGTDTWLVALLFRISIDLNDHILNKTGKEVDIQTVKEKLGDRVVFEARRERNFINETMKDDVIEEIKQSYVTSTLKYVSHPEFAEKYVLKKYHDKK